MSDEREVVSDGESIIVPAGHHVVLQCCDCGLVHDIWPSYDAQRRRVSIMFVRNNEETKLAQRKMKRNRTGVFKLWPKKRKPNA